MKREIPLRGLIMWTCAAVFYGFQFLIRVSPSVMTDDLMASLGVEACALGILASFYYYGYSFMQIPAGLMLDYLGPRRPLTLACTLCFAGSLVFALGNTVVLLSIGRLLMGVGSAFGFITCIKIASTWFPPHRLTLFVGLSVLIGTTGATSGGKPLAHLVEATSWKTAIYILAGLSVVLAIAAWSIVRDTNPENNNPQNKKLAFSRSSIVASLLAIFKNPQTWLFGLYGFLMYVPLSGFADLWGVPFLMKVFGVDRTTAGLSMSTFYVGMGAGGPAWSWLITNLRSYRKTMALSAIITCPIFIIMIYFPYFPFSWTYVLFFIAGAASAGQFLAFGGVTDINTRERTATASGAHNMLCMISGVLMQPVIGLLLDLSWDRTFVNGAPNYVLSDYHFALSSLPVSLAIAAVVVFFIREVYPDPDKKIRTA